MNPYKETVLCDVFSNFSSGPDFKHGGWHGDVDAVLETLERTGQGKGACEGPK